jgi:putative endonuclease
MPHKHKVYHVYILASTSKRLYVGVTGNLYERVLQHKKKEIPGFTQRYNVDKLVYYEETSSIEEAILREKQIKGWLREKKIRIIETLNRDWVDLSRDWY